jgi:hypothetical protein
MFSSINFLKIDSNEYLSKYVDEFDRLIHQKDEDRSAKIDQIMNEIKDKNIFKIEGDDNFEKEVYRSIKELLQVKPGRVLFKNLINTFDLVSEIKPISIESGGKYIRFSDGGVRVDFDDISENKYNALPNSSSGATVCSTIKAIKLGHELIHELHYRMKDVQDKANHYHADTRIGRVLKQDPACDFLKNIKPVPVLKFKDSTVAGFESPGLVFNKLDNLEEEHTILGVNIPNYLQNEKKLNKIDVLSENALLCAFHYLPRIDHKEAVNDNVENISLDQNHLSNYYKWLLDQLNERNAKIEVSYASLLD